MDAKVIVYSHVIRSGEGRICGAWSVFRRESMADIFISYRRRDNAHAAGRLHDQLAKILGVRKLFMDIDRIPPGADFVNVLDWHVANCKVLLAVIGPGWTLAKDERGQLRLWTPDDFVRIEIIAALRREIPVVPVLIDGASLPKKEQLPEQLQPLLRRNAVEISHETFASDVFNLVNGLRPVISPTFGWLQSFSWMAWARPRPANSPYMPMASKPVATSEVVQTTNQGRPLTNSLVEEFFRDEVLLAYGASVTATELYEAFCGWCEEVKRDPIALPQFAREFSDMGIQKKKFGGRVRYIGIALRHF